MNLKRNIIFQLEKRKKEGVLVAEMEEKVAMIPLVAEKKVSEKIGEINKRHEQKKEQLKIDSDNASKFIGFFVLLIACITPFNDLYAQDFNVSKVSGHQYSYKPSLSQRLQGINDVVVIVPKSQSKVDQYYYTCITNYFKRLGVPTRTYSARFNKKTNKLVHFK